MDFSPLVRPSPSASQLAQRYLVDRHLPDSAIDILDEASSKKTVSFGQLSKGAAGVGDKLRQLQVEKDRLVREEDWGAAGSLRCEEKKYKKKLEHLVGRQEKEGSAKIEEKDVAEIVSTMTGIPVEELTASEAAKLLDLEKHLAKKVISQGHVLRQLGSVLRRNRVGLRDPRRPAGSFIFLGASGVGKTLVAEALAAVLFDDPEALVRLDMSEFSERHTVSRLVGAPPGYVGYEEGGELTDKLRRKPYSVVLLDEIEKAHPEIFNALLQVLDTGRLMEGKGRTVNFRNTIIIMTSNVGSHLIKKEGDLGFVQDKESSKSREATYQNISSKLKDELRKSFKPEFLNRVDSTIVFRPLNKPTVRKIAKLLVKEAAGRLKTEHKMKLKVEPAVYDLLVEEGFSEEFGAREMRRTVTEMIEDPLSEGILADSFKKGQVVTAKVEKDRVVLK